MKFLLSGFDPIAAKIAAGSFGASVVSLSLTTPFPAFGVTANVVFAAAAGAYASFAYPVEQSRGKLFALAPTNAAFGAAALALVNWYFIRIPPDVQAPVAFFLAFFARWYIPAIIDRVPSAVGSIFGRIFPKSKPEQGE
jgi:hypothetical protein